MTDLIEKPKFSRRTGMTHGIRAFVDGNRLPSGRAYKRAMKEVSLKLDRLVVKYGGDKIQPDVLVMLEGAAKAMVVQELCSLYIKKTGILRRDSLDQGNLELHSVLAKSYASYSNLVRLNLEAAARLAGIRLEQSEPDVMAYITAFDAQKAAQEAQGGPQDAPGERSQADEAQGQGEEGKP